MIPHHTAMKTLITVCTYNERENLTTLIPAIRQALPHADLLIVDDNSPDGTAEVVRQFASTDPQIHLLLRLQKAGLGAATLHGFQEGIRRGYDVLINMDADWSHPPALLPDLLDALSRVEVAVASRYVPGGGVQNWPWRRQVMSWGVNAYSRFWLKIQARDCSGAFRAYRTSILKQIDLAGFQSRGYAFQEEMLYRCQSAGARIEEIPFTFVDREIGSSKINVREVARALTDIARLGLSRLVKGPPRNTPGTSSR